MITTENLMINKWNYDPQGEVCYGNELVYQKVKDFLVDNVEDWGCGTGWAGHYFEHYKGIDGSPSGIVTELVDLREYTSSVDNIILRQVLEHNYDWKLVLDNAVKSFNKKLFIGIHTPFSEETKVISVSDFNQVPDMSFRVEDILDCVQGLKVTQEIVKTDFEYGEERIFYVEK